MVAMRSGSSSRFVLSLIPAAALFCGAAAAWPQNSQNQSVVEAARRAREQKKQSGRPSKTITEDELYRDKIKLNQGINVIGPDTKSEAQQPASGAAATEPTDKAAASAKTPEKKSDDEAEAAKLKRQIADVKEQIVAAQKDLDLLQRQLVLDTDAYSSKPDYQRDAAGKTKLENEKQQISDKQQELDNLKTRLAVLQELLARIKPGSPEATSPPADNKPAEPQTPAQPPRPM
jgi:hypothetical protein